MSACPGKVIKIIVLLFACFLCLCISASGDTTPVPTVSPEPVNLTTMPIDFHRTATPFPSVQPTVEMPLVFSGIVVRGGSWEAAGPMAGVTVACHCSNDPLETGTVVASAVTDAEGSFAVTVNEACRYYTLALPGDPPTDADSVSGTVLPGGSIRYEEPLAEKDFSGNRFFFSTGEATAPVTPAGSPVPAGTRFAPSAPLPGLLVILGVVVAGVWAARVRE